MHHQIMNASGNIQANNDFITISSAKKIYKYLLPVKDPRTEINTAGTVFNIKTFPNFMTIKILSTFNTLCPNRYGEDVRCFWEGDVSAKLPVNNQKLIELNDHDERKQTVLVGDKIYFFQGQRTLITDSNSENPQTFLVFTIERDI